MKTKAGIIGTGNIGTDLLMKMIRSDFIEPVIFVGRRADSDGIHKALDKGIDISLNGIDYFKGKPNKFCDVVFDCTNSMSARENYDVFAPMGIKVIDMTPAKLGPMCVPIINPEVIISYDNINMITCGGQTSIPILHLISKCCKKIDYIEIVSQIASKSAGMATRENLDQYIHTTEHAIRLFTDCHSCKVILNINPAEPCVDMQTTMFIKSSDIDFDVLQEKLNERIKQVRLYVPHYEMVMMPIINEDGILILSIRVRGAGDYLPSYAGNLDIINCAAINVVERISK
jgi:acetaldehyde dehydrogenase (acetylating)